MSTSKNKILYANVAYDREKINLEETKLFWKMINDWRLFSQVESKGYLIAIINRERAINSYIFNNYYIKA